MGVIPLEIQAFSEKSHLLFRLQGVGSVSDLYPILRGEPVLKLVGRKQSGVTWVPEKRVWKKSIGFKRIDGGRRVPTVFYLGGDRKKAELEGEAIKARWRWFRMQGAEVWPDREPDRSVIRRALGLEHPAATAGLPAPALSPLPSSPVPASPPVAAVRGGLSLDFAARLYIARQEARLKTGEISERHLCDTKKKTARCVGFIGEQTLLTSLNDNRLRTFVESIRFEQRFSLTYAANLVNQLRWLLDWASKDDRCRYIKPPEFDSVLVIRKAKPRTDAEHQAAEAEAFGDDTRFFTVDQVAKLFRCADDRLKLCILLGLNCGFYPADIATLRLRHVKRGGIPRIEKIRSKTGVPGQWELWPETLALIDRVYQPNPDGLIVRTAFGSPIASDTKNYLAGLFADLKAQVGAAEKKKKRSFDCPHFKFLRHTAANVVKEIGGGEVSETFLAHKELLKLQSTYTARLWAKVGEALREARRTTFAPAFDQ